MTEGQGFLSKGGQIIIVLQGPKPHILGVAHSALRDPWLRATHRSWDDATFLQLKNWTDMVQLWSPVIAEQNRPKGDIQTETTQ